MSQDDRRVPRDGWDDDRTRHVPVDDAATQRWDREWEEDPDATRVIPVMPPDDGPRSYPTASANPDDEAFDAHPAYASAEERYAWRAPQEEPVKTRGRTGWIIAVVALAVAVIVLLVLLLGGRGEEQSPTAPADTPPPTEEVPAEPEPEVTEDPAEQDGGVLDDLRERLPSDVPTELPDVLPSDLPDVLPSDLPTELPEGLGEDVEQQLRDGLGSVTDLFEGATSGESTP